MRVAVLSDIHGNHIALEKCMEEIERRKIQKLIFLGDYVGELAYPQKTMAYLRKIMKKYECNFIRGNKEDYWLDREHDQSIAWKEGDSTTGALLYAYSNLNYDDISFFESLSHMKVISFDGLPAIAAYHGSHDSKGKKLGSNTDSSHILFRDTEESIILCGHTHIRNKILCADRVLFNPGSVGVPLESNGVSQFLILSGEQGKWQYEFVDVSYDIESVIQELHEEDLYAKAPCWTRVTENLLRNGDISHGTVLSRAMQLLYNDTGKWCWPDIPEQYWERAIGELIDQEPFN
ncbi:MAG: metallophosphoesterase family protein [Lachnospiraceae bacterium]|nr:metallophosphoesterase family protein [Lachnospiraceae bacterium]